MPQGHDMVKSSSIPLVLGIQPFAVQAKGDSAIPLIDTRGSELVRCGKCNAYVCPGMTFRGGTMTCCFCGGSTAVNTMAHGDAPSRIYGMSVTEPCLDWTSTADALERLAASVRQRRAAASAKKPRTM